MRSALPESMTDRLPAVNPSSGLAVGARGHDVDAGPGDVQLLGGDLTESGDDALTELDLADPDLDVAVAPEADPLRQERVGAEALPERHGTGRRRGGRCGYLRGHEERGGRPAKAGGGIRRREADS